MEDTISIFISLNSRNLTLGEGIAEILKEEGYQPRIYSWDVAPGESFVEFMEESIKQSKVMVLLWSEYAESSYWVSEEYRGFHMKMSENPAIKIIIVKLDETEVPPLMKDKRYIKYRRNRSKLRNELLWGITGENPKKHRIRLSTTQSELDIRMEHALHTKEADRYIHSVSLDITNKAQRLMRIGDIQVYDDLDHQLEFISRGHTSVTREIDLEPNSSAISWWAFCINYYRTEPTHVKLRLAFDEIGKETHWYTVESTLVPNDKFPTGRIIDFIDF